MKTTDTLKIQSAKFVLPMQHIDNIFFKAIIFVALIVFHNATSFGAPPCTYTIANAGLDQSGCTTVTLAGNTPSYGTGAWSIVSGAGGVLTNPTSSNATFSGVIGSTYQLRWTITGTTKYEAELGTLSGGPMTAIGGGASGNGYVDTWTTTGATGIFSVFATIAGAQNVTFGYASGFYPDRHMNLYVNGVLIKDLVFIGPGSWVWTTITESLVLNAGLNTIEFRCDGNTNDDLGNRWGGINFDYITVPLDPACTPSSDDVTITLTGKPTTSVAGTDQTFCSNTATTLAANTPSQGGGLWSIISGTGGSVTSPTSPTSAFSGTNGQNYLLRWTISNKYEAENATLSGGANMVSNKPGYSGTGFVEGYWMNIGATTTFNVNTITAGAHNVTMKYSNGMFSTQTISIYVNGVYIKKTSLATSNKDWNSWEEQSELLSLNAGSNTITYKSDAGDGAVNIDCITLYAPIRYQAESATLSGAAISGNSNLGFLGNGYVEGYGTNGATTTFNVTATAATGSHEVTLRYSNATGSTQIISIYVNGVFVKKTSLVATANWESWAEQTESLTLNNGANTIAYKRDVGDGTANLDCISIINYTGSVSTDDVSVSFGGGFNVANAGTDQTNLLCGVTSATLAGNTAVGGTGRWSIVSGMGGRITTPTSPTSTFTGVLGSSYQLRWSISDLSAVTVKYEAENAILSATSTNTNHTGYSGAGFVDGYDNSGDLTMFAINAVAAGTYNVTLRYSSAGADRTISIYVNGLKIKKTTLIATADWNTWADNVESLTLNSGNNNITYKRDVDDNAGANIDYISLATSTCPPSIDDVTIVFNSNPVFTVTNPAAVCAPNTVDVTLATQNLPSIDATAPSIPTALVSSSIGPKYFSLSWKHSTDNVGGTGVVLYEIKQGGVVIGTTADTSMRITGLTPSTSYPMSVCAIDASGNYSVYSAVSNITTAAAMAIDTAAASGSSKLIMHLKFDELAGVSANDASVNNNDGGLNNVSFTAGHFNNGIKLLNPTSVSTDYVGVSNSASINSATTAITLSIWVNSKNWDGNRVLIRKHPHNPNYQFNLTSVRDAFDLTKEYFNFSIHNGTTQVGVTANIESYILSPLNEWHMITGTWDGTTMKLFVDANEIASAPISGTITINGDDVLLGNKGTYGEDAFEGMLDDAWIVGRAFNEEEIIALYNGDKQAPSIPTALNATSINSNWINLSWTASTDNYPGAISYDVYKNGILYSSTTGTSMNIIGLTRLTTYMFTVKARDAAANISNGSQSLKVTTIDYAFSFWTNAVATTVLATPTAVAASGTYYIKGVAGTCSSINPVVVTINPLPSASLTGTTSVCKGAASPTITFTGSSATAPYIFTYKLNNGAPQTITSVANTATITVATSTVDTFGYALVSVKDASTTTCSKVVSDSETVIVNPAPASPVSGGDTSYCSGTTIPTISATVLAGESIDWYNEATGGAIVKANSTSFTPTSADTYYAQTKSALVCVSATRTPVVITINSLPNAPSNAVPMVKCVTGLPQTLQAKANVAVGDSIVWYDDNNIVVPQGKYTGTNAIQIVYKAEAISTKGCRSATKTPCDLVLAIGDWGEVTQNICSTNQIDLDSYLAHGNNKVNNWVSYPYIPDNLLSSTLTPKGLKGGTYVFTYKSACSSALVKLIMKIDSTKPVIHCDSLFISKPDGTGSESYTFKTTDKPNMLTPLVDDCGNVSLSHNLGLKNDTTLLDKTINTANDSIIVWTAIDAFDNIGKCSSIIRLDNQKIPNIMTPNTDGKNDTWPVTLTSNQRIELFNRWGQVVVTLRPNNMPWDGRSENGKLVPVDSYIYQLWDGSSIKSKGFLSVAY